MTTTEEAKPEGGVELSPSEFARLAAIAREDAGIALPEGKRLMVQSRLARHLRRNGHESFESYIRMVEKSKGGPEREDLISLLTTNVSSFFRENHHFDTLARDVLPELIAAARGGARVRLWSAGCSTGQEPYSIAMQALSLAEDVSELDFRILATDIDRVVLKTAVEGTYAAREAEGIPQNMQSRFVTTTDDGANIRIGDAPRALVTFRQLNLIATWPMRGKFDVIFCRNVVIYFDDVVQGGLWPRFCDALHDNGWFFLGHSERLSTAAEKQFQTAGVTTFRKRPALKGAA